MLAGLKDQVAGSFTRFTGGKSDREWDKIIRLVPHWKQFPCKSTLCKVYGWGSCNSASFPPNSGFYSPAPFNCRHTCNTLILPKFLCSSVLWHDHKIVGSPIRCPTLNSCLCHCHSFYWRSKGSLLYIHRMMLKRTSGCDKHAIVHICERQVISKLVFKNS